MEKIKIRLTLTEDLLGTASGNKELYADYIATKAPTADMVEQEIDDFNPELAMEKAMTVFPRLEDGTPFLYDYQIKGFFKDSAGVLRKVPKSFCSKVKAYKKEIDGLLFPQPRKIPIKVNGEMGICERPLRAATPMGERVALSISESIPAGSTLEFEISFLTEDMKKLALECLDYGILRGLGQWRNSGKGRFTYEILS
jgi:hypothetical protein